jgi:hypothetical protein
MDTNPQITAKEDTNLTKPYKLEDQVRSELDSLFREQMLFDAGPDLSLITCKNGPGEYSLSVFNNSYKQKPLKIESKCGNIERLEELPLDHSEAGAVGQLPAGSEGAPLGENTADTIAGGEVRVFRLRVHDADVADIPHLTPPARPAGRILPLRGARPIEEEVLMRPTFFQHFDAVSVDWRYLHDSDRDALAREAGWIGRQRLGIYVDLTSGINLYPDLRLVDNSETDYQASMGVIDDVLGKMEVLGAQGLILSMHRVPENNISVQHICAKAAAKHITVYLRLCRKDGVSPEDLVRFVDEASAPNLRLAASTGYLTAEGADSQKLRGVLGNRLGLWLVSASARDIADKPWSSTLPVAGSPNTM